VTWPTLYFDRNVGKSIPEALWLLGIHTVHHNTKRSAVGLRESEKQKTLFAQNEKDDVWLEFVGKKDWLVFTQDRKFHKAGFEHEMSATSRYVCADATAG